MNNASHMHKFLLLGAIMLGLGLSANGAHAATFNMPGQTDCDSGSTTLTWDGEGIARPQIASMTVDGVAITDPANPDENSLGAVVCPSTTRGNRTTVSVIWHTAEGNTADLTDALTPNGDPVTADTDIALTMTDLGDNAANLTFTLVYGSVSAWTTSGLGSSTASVVATISPVRTPQGSGDDFNLCTAVPPDCHANQSDEDVLGASMALSFEPNVGTNMRGAYFALTGAMGGYVTSATAADGSKTLVATLGAPHFLADGVTLNTGSMTAFLPQASLNTLFGLTAGDVDTTTLDVTRTSGSTTTSAVPFTIQAVAGGVTLTVPTITFSSPKYTIKMTSAGLQQKQKNAVTPSKSKSSLKTVGKNIAANGKSSFTIEVIVRNKLGKSLNVTPTLTTSSPTTKIGKPVFKNKKWLVKVTSTKKGTKKISVSAKGVRLNPVTVTFVAP